MIFVLLICLIIFFFQTNLKKLSQIIKNNKGIYDIKFKKHCIRFKININVYKHLWYCLIYSRPKCPSCSFKYFGKVYCISSKQLKSQVNFSEIIPLKSNMGEST